MSMEAAVGGPEPRVVIVTLIRLVGRTEHDSAEFATRAGRVRDIGVRSAMLQEVFFLALTLVSALALGPNGRALWVLAKCELPVPVVRPGAAPPACRLRCRRCRCARCPG